ncbi:MAG TPA: PLDc N-terminal domain-containing protein [Mycobacteriales bacterium]|nr:PLDc N-terminal domain-containing protein [Mycobacteriales bacterium]
MLLTRGVPILLLVLLWLYCLFDAISADSARVRNLPKGAWVVIVLIFPDIGSVLWLVAGRPRGQKPSAPYKGNTGVPPEYDRPGRATAGNPDDDAAFLEQLKRRAEEQRRKAAEEAERIRGEEQPPPA